MDAASLYSLLGFIVFAAIVYAIAQVAPAPFNGVGRFVAGLIAAVGLIIFVIHVFVGLGIVK